MPAHRRRAALALLSWAIVGLLVSAGVNSASSRTGARDVGSCHHAMPASSGEHSSSPTTPSSPCQWVLPLLCCQQPAAADAVAAHLVELGTLWVRVGPSDVSPAPPLPLLAVALAPAMPSPPRARSVVLQV